MGTSSKGAIEVPDWLIPKPPHDRRPGDHPNPVTLQIWRDKVLLRDDFSCQWCKKSVHVVERLEVHHLTYENFGDEKEIEGVTLCNSCHAFVTEETRRQRCRLSHSYSDVVSARKELLRLSKACKTPLGSYFYCDYCMAYHITKNPADNVSTFI